jgi:hypothetical protein
VDFDLAAQSYERIQTCLLWVHHLQVMTVGGVILGSTISTMKAYYLECLPKLSRVKTPKPKQLHFLEQYHKEQTNKVCSGQYTSKVTTVLLRSIITRRACSRNVIKSSRTCPHCNMYEGLQRNLIHNTIALMVNSF